MKTQMIVVSMVVGIALVVGAGVGCFFWGSSSGYDKGWDEGYNSGNAYGYEVGYDAGIAEAPLPEKLNLYLEFVAVYLEGSAVMYEIGESELDWVTAAAMERLLGEIDNDALLDAYWAYQYCEWYEADHYWAVFLDTLGEQLGSYLE
ncbi:hypothetical protein ES703_60370 [subsurface metagenome]